jgi:multisubunit Na+/H+ antiporter MnhB subunit
MIVGSDIVPTRTLPNEIEGDENVGFASIPLPLSATNCGLPLASSLMDKCPLRAPVWVGLNDALIAQVAAGAMLFPLHVSFVMLNCPDGATLAICRVAPVVFLTVVVFEALVAATTMPPKLNVSGVIVSLPATPTPLSAADPALAFSVSLTASEAWRVPNAAGVKVSLTAQLVPLASVEPQPLLVIVNSLGSAPLS